MALWNEEKEVIFGMKIYIFILICSIFLITVYICYKKGGEEQEKYEEYEKTMGD